MAASPPNPLLGFSKTIFSAPFGLGQKIEHLFDYWYQLAAGESPNWRRWQLTCEDLNSTVSADDAVVTFDVVNFTGSAIDSSWTTSDYDTVRGQLEVAVTGYAAYQPPTHRWSHIAAYVMEFNPDWANSDPSTKRNPFKISGAPDYESALNSIGTGPAGELAPQTSFSVTEEVPIRRSWGRFYLPFPGTSLLSGPGRWGAAGVDAIVGKFHTCYQNLAASEFYPVVATTYSQKARVASLQQVTALHADDVPDVIRSRRPKYVAYKKRLPPVAGATQQPA